MALYEFKNVSKVYPMGETEVRALDGVDLVVEDGMFTAVLGPSGSGKSTLMNLMGLMDQPTSGEVLFEGVDVTSLSKNHRAETRASKIGFVFQAFNLLPRLTVLENVILPLLYLHRKRADAIKAGRDLLDHVGLDDRARHYPAQLSGGQRQRVAIARALVNSPRLILADEPTGNLDSENAERTLETFKSLNREGRTIVLITHDSHVASAARRRVLVRDGRILDSPPGKEKPLA